MDSNSTNQNESLKYFAGAVAKEARNAAVIVRDCNEVIRDNLEEIKKFMHHMELSSKRHLSIVDMLLLNIHEEKLDPSKFNKLSISQVVNLAIREYVFESDEQKNRIRVNVEDDFKFKGDETAMVYVIFNLLRNALDKNANVSIWSSTINRQLYFKDDGSVIPLEMQDAIFGDSCTFCGKDSNSFGLLFCRKVIESFGGKISCNSIGDEYTLFTLRF